VGEGDCQDWAGIDKLTPNHIQAKIQTFERPNSKQDEVGFFAEHDVVGGCSASGMYDRVADVAVDASTVRNEESLAPLHPDVERFEYRTGNPRKFATGVYQGIREFADPSAL
jgi:hypothetical protein